MNAVVDSALIWWVNAIAAGLWVALLLAGLTWAVLAIRKAPLAALLPATLYLFCLGVRLLSAERLPMISAHGDFTHLRDITVWMHEGLQRFVGASTPSGGRMLHYLAFQLFGPSVELAFGLGVAVGAATVVPVYLVARSLTGSWFGGLAAALAYSAYPPAVAFTNGIALESTSAFLLTLSFAAFLSNLKQRSHLASLVWVLSTLLFVQSRGEGLVIGALAIFVQAMLAWHNGALKAIASQWWWAAIAGVIAIPYMSSVIQFSEPGLVQEFATEASWKLATALALCLGSVLLGRAARGGRQAAIASVTLWTILVLAAGTVVFTRILGHYGQGDFWLATAKSLPEYPYLYFYGIHPIGDLGFLIAPGVFPFYFFLFLVLGLLPIKEQGRWSPNVSAMLLLAVPVTADLLLSTRATGQAIAEGFRYHIPQSGLLAVLVGLGAYWLWHLVEERRFVRWVVGSLAAAGMLLPLVTHHAFLADAEFNIQREYRFVRECVADFPDKTLMLVPDFQVNYRWERTDWVDITERFRVEHLLFATVSMEGKATLVMHLWRDRERLMHLKRDILVYLGQDCYRVNAPTEVHPWCKLLATHEGSTLVRSQTIPNRRFCGGGLDVLGPRTPTLELGLYRLTPDAVRAVLTQLAGPTGTE